MSNKQCCYTFQLSFSNFYELPKITCIGFGVRFQTVGWLDFVLCVGLCASGAETVPSRAGTPCVRGPA